MYDFAVVGAGMFGASFARTMADRGRRILVLDKRSHVGGNCHTEIREGIQVHVYGPHVFHTDDPELWAWVGRFATWKPMICRNVAMAKGRLWPLPMNLMLFHQLWGVKTPEEAKKAVQERKVVDADTKTLKGWVLANLGAEIYETFIEGYSWKQWGRKPETLPASIIQRLPIRFTHDQNYFRDRYQGVPEEGYTAMFQRMLDHPQIEVQTGMDYLAERKSIDHLANQVIYSGRLDEYHDMRYGALEFRSARFVHKTLDGDYQGHFAIYHCDMESLQTRTIEHKHFSNPDAPKTIVTWEYPYECKRPADIPFYPIEDTRNRTLYEAYRKLPAKAIFGGRLGHYSYMDMNQAVAEARKLCERMT
jgi:UDP-galactopyranose mutase